MKRLIKKSTPKLRVYLRLRVRVLRLLEVCS